MNLKLLGLSSQSIKQQIKIKERLKLPFELISDEGLILKRLFDLPTFCVDGAEYYERLTLVIRDGMIKNVFYPVLSPQTHVHEVVDWLRKTDQKDVMEGIHDSGN